MTESQTISAVNNPQPDRSAERRAFLRALYGTSPDDLYLELRCIHPETGEVQRLWGRLGDKRGLASALRQADRLNREGFGVYFAPCLRRSKQGTADSAALATALWIDMDSDSVQRPRDLERLRSFNPPPSFIVDSGGGLHGYWLLDAPIPLDEDKKREHFASLLNGLFAALGGDARYVKSAASVMRLPGSVNTKPGRDQARVRIVESHPDRRHAVSAFAWLESPPSEPSKGPTRTKSSDSEEHPLPARTEHYLESGAPNGSRNAELFAAACQLRDAGLSLTHAEQELVARYLADGTGRESATAREREARATIASAFRQPPRAPIPHSATAQEQVAALVEHAHARPNSAQIVEAVKACAALNPVEWAEERQRLKALCGDGLKVGDLDRLYRDERKRLARSEAQAFREKEHYVEVDGKLVYQRQTARGVMEKVVTDWTAKVVERVTRMDDDGQVEHVAVVELRRDQVQAHIDVPSELFGDDAALRRFIAGRAGEAFTVRAGMAKHLTPAILSLSGTYASRASYRFMGWTQIDGHWAYITPKLCVTAKSILKEAHEVELESRLRDYHLAESDWEASLKAFAAMAAVFPPELAPTLIAFACLPLFQRFFPSAAPKPALHLVGTTGSGKSEIASLMTSLYGDFSRDTPPAQWGDTVNTVEALGYALADALYWVDDFKHIYADERTFTRFLQSYSRGMGRGRLTREAKVRQERPCRGHLLSTGETTLTGEASVLARMIALEVPPWEQRDPVGLELARAVRLRGYLPGFTAHLAQWVAAQADQGILTKDMMRRFEARVDDYRKRLAATGLKANNTGRIVGNWAVLATVYQMLGDLLASRGKADVLPAWYDLATETAQSMQEERAGHTFLNVLGQLVASGQCLIESSLRPQYEPSPGKTVVGYRDDGFVYLLPDVALKEVNYIQPLRFTGQAVGVQLREDGLLVPGTTNLTVQRSVRGSVISLWRLRAEALVGEAEASED
ncbi:MAG: DUF927 domain-containing protein [Anaerolineae bacterium]|nr:DUF927 domain-containing protein [Anaerolineae bacterium]